MLVIVCSATDCIIRLCSNGHYVATVLHMYNLLRQSGAMTEELVVLESLCGTLLHTIFSGARPERKYHSQYANFLGGRLELDRSKRHESNSDKDSCKKSSWRITMPKKYVRRITSHDISLFHALYACEFSFVCHAWANVWYGLNREKWSTRQTNRECPQRVRSPPFRRRARPS